ncbi:hypothetical protein QTP88_022451 [Uroleucon formosanum]
MKTRRLEGKKNSAHVSNFLPEHEYSRRKKQKCMIKRRNEMVTASASEKKDTHTQTNPCNAGKKRAAETKTKRGGGNRGKRNEKKACPYGRDAKSVVATKNIMLLSTHRTGISSYAAWNPPRIDSPVKTSARAKWAFPQSRRLPGPRPTAPASGNARRGPPSDATGITVVVVVVVPPSGCRHHHRRRGRAIPQYHV